MISFIKNSSGVYTVYANGTQYVFGPSHKNYGGLVEAIKESDTLKIEKLYNVGEEISEWTSGNFKYANGVLTYKGRSIPDELHSRIVDMIREGFDYKPMLLFVENLYQNPSSRSVSELFNFLSHKGLPITPDGLFLAHKAVKIHNGETFTDLIGREVKSGDYVDIYTGNSYRNNVGDTNTVERNQVDDNCERHCSFGLHCGTRDYAVGYGSSYGSIVVTVAVNPADVVSVPSDSNCQKVRVSKYVVTAIESQDFNTAVVNESIHDSVIEPNLDAIEREHLEEKAWTLSENLGISVEEARLRLGL